MAPVSKTGGCNSPVGSNPTLSAIFMTKEKSPFRFETIAEARAWQKKKYPNGGGLYQLDRICLGEVREEWEAYQEWGNACDTDPTLAFRMSCMEFHMYKKGITDYQI